MKQHELVKQLTDKQVLFHLYLTQVFLLVVALLFGFFLFPSFTAFQSLWKWDPLEVLIYGGGSAMMIIGLDQFLTKVLPEHALDDGGLNEKMFKERSVVHILLLTMMIATIEEILFRGVVQTFFGYFAASILFALMHIRYLQKWILFTLVCSISFFIGFLFLRTGNLWVTIVCHFLVDFVSAIVLKKGGTKHEG